jgi:hypothetical protein
MDQYPAILSRWEYMAAAKESGEPYVVLEFRISEGEFEGRKQWRNFSLQRQSLWALKKALVNMGADPDDLEGAFDLDDLMPDYIGSACLLDISQHTYEGTIRNDIKAVLPAE